MAKVKDEVKSSVPSSRARSSGTYSQLGPGGSCLDFWTRSLGQYKQLREALLCPCTVRTDKAPKVRFFATLGQEPEVELAESFYQGYRE